MDNKESYRKKRDKSPNRKERSRSPKSKKHFDFENAVIISSESKPGDTVKRVILEVPLDSNIEISNEKECNKLVQTSKSLVDQVVSSSSSSSSISTTYSTVSSHILCSCCRKFAPLGESMSGLCSDLFADHGTSIFFDPCLSESKKKPWIPDNSFLPQQQQQQQQQKGYCNQNLNGNNNNSSNSALEKIRNTLKELHELDIREDYCKSMAQKLSRPENISSICHCKRSSKGPKKPVAYLLTFEPGDLDLSQITNKAKSLDEIRIKIPGMLGKHKRESADNLEKKQKDEKEDKPKKHKHSKSNKSRKSLQEYLENNNPSFIKAAEERRKCLVELEYMREQRCEKYKQLMALTNGIPSSNWKMFDNKR